MASHLHDQRTINLDGVGSRKHIHEIGVQYVHHLLDRVGFTIHDVNEDPDHYFQLLAQVNGKALLIAVRTACHPDVGVMWEATRNKLIKESGQFNAIPHFAGLSLTSVNGGKMQADKLADASDCKIIFHGMTVVR